MLFWDSLEDPSPSGGFLGYRAGTATSIPSSPSAASVSSSTMSMQDRFEDSPSVKELCEMLSESVNMQQADRTLTGENCCKLFELVCVCLPAPPPPPPPPRPWVFVLFTCVGLVRPVQKMARFSCASREYKGERAYDSFSGKIIIVTIYSNTKLCIPS